MAYINNPRTQAANNNQTNQPTDRVRHDHRDLALEIIKDLEADHAQRRGGRCRRALPQVEDAEGGLGRLLVFHLPDQVVGQAVVVHAADDEEHHAGLELAAARLRVLPREAETDRLAKVVAPVVGLLEKPPFERFVETRRGWGLVGEQVSISNPTPGTPTLPEAKRPT